MTPPIPLLTVERLHKRFGDTRVVNDVSFEIDRGEVVALVGESGSGKTTVARLLARLDTPTSGAIRIAGTDVLVSEPRGASLAYRRRVQMIFQDPYASLNPAHTVGHHLERPLSRHRRVEPAEIPARVEELLTDVGLTPAAQIALRRPHELSGGQRQRVAIARALAVSPDLLIADEPTSMLDVSLRVDVLNLLASLREKRWLAILFITHDLASARYLADRILVMSGGAIIDGGATEELLAQPTHPYTRRLLAAVPSGSGRTAEPLGSVTRGAHRAPRDGAVH
jgi:ABC-type glutathione transport system ATPase component